MDPNTVRAWLADRWGAELEAAIGSMVPARPAITVRPALHNAAVGLPGDMIWFSQGFSRCQEKMIWVGAAPSAWNVLGQALMSALGLEDAPVEDMEAACRDLVAQSGKGLTQRLADHLETRFTPEAVAKAPAPAHQPAATLWVDLAEPRTRIELVLVKA